jgi:hypothetical protein
MYRRRESEMELLAEMLAKTWPSQICPGWKYNQRVGNMILPECSNEMCAAEENIVMNQNHPAVLS